MMTTSLDRYALTATLRALHPAKHRLDFLFGECGVSVFSNRLELAEELAAYFKPFVSRLEGADISITAIEAPPPVFDESFAPNTPEPGKTRIKEEYIELQNGRLVRKRLTGMVFIFGEGDNLAIGPCMENPNQVVNFINNRYIEWMLCRDALLGHAAGVAMNGCGLSLAGFSGAGKSTLALHIMSRGAVFISNDRLMIEKTEDGLAMHGVAKHPRINPGTILHNPDLHGIIHNDDHRKYMKLHPEELHQLELKHDAFIEECFGPGRFALRAVMAGLVILNWERNDHPMRIRRVDPFTRSDLLPALMKPTGLFFHRRKGCRMPEPTPEAYARLIDRGYVWEISGGIDFHGAADACLHFMRNRSMPKN